MASAADRRRAATVAPSTVWTNAEHSTATTLRRADLDGVLLWARPALPWTVLVAPLLWAIAATFAALDLGMREDLGLTAAAIATTALARRRRGRQPPSAEATREATLAAGR